MSSESQNKVYQTVTDSLIESLEQGTAPWQHYTLSQASSNFTTSKRYNGINSLILSHYQSKHNFKTGLFATYKQWAQIGLQVKEGSKGFPIFRPLIGKDKDTSDAKVFGMSYHTVFNADQVEGFQYAEIGELTEKLNSIQAAEDIINSMPQRPSISHDSGIACYRTLTDSVHMPSVVTCGSEEYYSILFHELSHSTGHESRLNRKSLKTIQGHSLHEYSKEELVAEMTAAILCNESGILNKTLENSAAYCRSWLKVLKNDRKMLVEAASQAFKAADFILGVNKNASNQ